ncbi:MAG: HypC/HybG/HupF family hydrogenase formation chaperone [Chloroflexi bacterium]|nr:HypC/HybG/HupF family hydrogenase formation chaperone [Chloroflexota bacterium]
MCLGVPGKVLSLEPNSVGMTMGKVSFGGVVKEVCLAYVPEAQVDDYVIVHAGFALNKLDEAEANEVFEALRELGEVMELEEPHALH